MLRKGIVVLGSAIALLVLSCVVGTGESDTTLTQGLTCPAGERAFNGSCRTICTTSATCGPLACMTVAPDLSLCLDYKQCGYLGTDTVCRRVGSEYGTRDPYWQPYEGPYSSPSSYAYGNDGSSSCAGNATWTLVAPTSNPQCGEQHGVVRCRKIGGSCRLVSGTTIDIAEP